jgi:hypothetical protein
LGSSSAKPPLCSACHLDHSFLRIDSCISAIVWLLSLAVRYSDCSLSLLKSWSHEVNWSTQWA